MPSLRTLRDLPHDSRDEPLHTPKHWGGSLIPELEKTCCEVWVTSEHSVTQPYPSIPILPLQISDVHEFRYEEGTSSEASVLQGGQDIPAERVFIVDVWKHGTCMSASSESPGCLKSKCEEAAGFASSTHEGNQFVFEERGPIDDQEKHGNCTSVTIETPELHDSELAGATSFNTSVVEDDALRIRVPSRAEASAIRSAGVLRSVWMWMLQKKDGPRIDDSEKHGFPICVSAISVIAGAVISSALQYVALPNVNPLQHQDRKFWWYCPLTCTLVWMPISISYFGILLDQFVLTGTGVQLTYLDLFLLWLVGSITMVSLLTVLSWASPLYPFPLVSVIAAPAAFTGLVIVFGLCVYPRLRRAVPKHGLRKIAAKALLVFALFEWSICLLQILHLLIALLNRSGSESLAVLVMLLAGSLREACTAATTKIAVLINPEAAIIGQNLVMACFGVGFTTIVGNGSSVLLVGVILLQDIIRGLIVGIMIGNVFIGQLNFSVFLLQLQPAMLFKLCTRRSSKLTENEFEQQKATLKSSLIASETGEVILPIAYLCSWLVVRIGPYSSSFSGIGTRDYGLDPPEMISRSVIVTVVLIVLEAFSVMLLKLSFRYFVGVSISFDESYKHFGKLLTVQNIWVVHTCFCARMISCGFDYSLQWDHHD